MSEPTVTTNSSNVSTGKPAVTGAIYYAPIGTTLPTDATTALATAFKGVGYISEDGLTNANTFDSENIKAWGGDTVYTIENNKVDTFQFKLIETLNVDVIKAVFGSSNVSGTLSTGITVSANSAEHGDLSWIAEMILRGGVLKRIVVPKAKISALAEIIYKDSEATGYDVTITAFPDSSGNTHYEYIKQPSSSGDGDGDDEG